MSSYPLSLVVNVEIVPERAEEFLKIMAHDASESIEKENGGCLRFDVLRVAENSSKFIFYEVYRDQQAIEFHLTTPHFKLFNDFKESGGVLSLTVSKAEALVFRS